MQRLETLHPVKLHARGRVQVNTTDGRPFYVFDKPEGFTFTLPAGSYTLSGGSLVGRMKARKGHRPRATLRYKLPKKVEVVYAPNPNKATISLPDGVIIVDPSLRELPAFCLTFVLFHEIGHYFYRDEESCDQFAAEEMHRRGFNPSQIDQAAAFTLGHQQRRACVNGHAHKLDTHGR